MQEITAMFHQQIYFMWEYHRIKVVQILKGEIMWIIRKVLLGLTGVPAPVPDHVTPPGRKRADMPSGEYTRECGFVQQTIYMGWF